MYKQLKHVDMFTDGACSCNPGPGGWCTILRFGTHEKEISGGCELTTNNRMELTAVIKGLDTLKEKCDVTIYCDSKYIIDAVTKGWAEKWRKNGWMRNKKESALNPDLWEKLLNLLCEHNVSFIWVKGHSGHPENERCDKVAVEQSRKFSN